jgi:hypothetical protein
VGDDSLGEQIQREFPRARVVRALNTVNCAVMVDPGLVEGDHVAFVCGEDRSARAETTRLLGELGWPARRVIDLGEISAARATEANILLWVRLAEVIGSYRFNFDIGPRGAYLTSKHGGPRCHPRSTPTARRRAPCSSTRASSRATRASSRSTPRCSSPTPAPTGPGWTPYTSRSPVSCSRIPTPDHYNGLTELVAGLDVPILALAEVDREIRERDVSSPRITATSFSPGGA